MVSLKRCYIMFVFIFQRHVVFQEFLPSIPWQIQVECDWGDGSPLFTGQLDKMTPEIVSCLWEACTMCNLTEFTLTF